MTAPAIVSPPAEVVALPENQAALFDDPAKLFALSLQDLRLVALEVAKEGGGIIRQIKRAAGLVASAMRRKVNDKEYGVWAGDFSELLGVTMKTLYDWRQEAERKLELPAVHTRKPSSTPSQNRRSAARTEIAATTATEPAEPDAPPSARPSKAPANGSAATTPRSAPATPARERNGDPSSRPSRDLQRGEGEPAAAPSDLGETSKGVEEPPKGAPVGNLSQSQGQSGRRGVDSPNPGSESHAMSDDEIELRDALHILKKTPPKDGARYLSREELMALKTWATVAIDCQSTTVDNEKVAGCPHKTVKKLSYGTWCDTCNVRLR